MTMLHVEHLRRKKYWLLPADVMPLACPHTCVERLKYVQAYARNSWAACVHEPSSFTCRMRRHCVSEGLRRLASPAIVGGGVGTGTFGAVGTRRSVLFCGCAGGGLVVARAWSSVFMSLISAGSRAPAWAPASLSTFVSGPLVGTVGDPRVPIGGSLVGGAGVVGRSELVSCACWDHCPVPHIGMASWPAGQVVGGLCVSRPAGPVAGDLPP